MRFRWPIRRGRIWPLTLLVIYGLSAWGLVVALPPRPRAIIALPWPPNEVLVSRDGSTLAARSADSLRSFGIFDTLTGRCLFNQDDGPECISLVDLAPDGHQLITEKSRDAWFLIAKLVLWQRGQDQSWKETELADAVNIERLRPRLSADGSTLAYSKGEKRWLTLWDVPSHRVRAVIEQDVRLMAFSPDGQLLATMATGPEPSVIIWSVQTGQNLKRLESVPPHIIDAFDSWVSGMQLAFSSNGARIGAIGAVGGISAGDVRMYGVCLWDTMTGALTAKGNWVPTGPSAILAAMNGYWERVFVAAKGENISDHFLVLDPFTGQVLHELSFTPGNYEWLHWMGHVSTGAEEVHSSPDGNVIAVSKFDRGATQPPILQWINMVFRLNRLNWAPDNVDQAVQIYDTASGQVLAALLGHHVCCFSAGSDILVTSTARPYNDGTRRQNALYVWDLPLRKPWLTILGGAAVPVLFVIALRWLVARRPAHGVKKSPRVTGTI